MITPRQRAAIIKILSPYKPTYIGIFGSYARNQETPESDIDILIQTPLGEAIGYNSAITSLETSLNKPINLGTPNKYKKILPYILRDLKPILGKLEFKEPVIPMEDNKELRLLERAVHYMDLILKETGNLSSEDLLHFSDFSILAISKAFEEIGEAAGKLSQDFKNSYSEIPFQKMKDFRNVLAHDYEGVDFNKMYEIIQSLPETKEKILKITEELREEQARAKGRKT